MNNLVLSSLRSRFRPFHGTGMPLGKARIKKDEARSAVATEPRSEKRKEKSEKMRTNLSGSVSPCEKTVSRKVREGRKGGRAGEMLPEVRHPAAQQMAHTETQRRGETAAA